MTPDRELVERWVAYCRRPKRRPLWSNYRLFGVELSEYLPDATTEVRP